MVGRTSEEDEEVNNQRIGFIVSRNYLESMRRIFLRGVEHEIQFNPEEQLNDPMIECGEPSFIFKKPKITGYCAICQAVLSKDFPEDYPYEWKFCCSCHGWAKSIVEDSDPLWLTWALVNSPIVKKIYKRMTIYG